jgi:hypothetical protein
MLLIYPKYNPSISQVYPISIMPWDIVEIFMAEINETGD